MHGAGAGATQSSTHADCNIGETPAFLVRAPGLVHLVAARTLSLTPRPLAPVIQSLVEPRARLGLANGGGSERDWGWLRELVAERAGMGQTLLGWAALRKHVARPPPCPQNTVLPRPLQLRPDVVRTPAAACSNTWLNPSMRERMVLHELDAFMQASTEEARVSGALPPPRGAPASLRARAS